MDKELKYLIEQQVEIKYKLSNEHIFIIGAYTDTLDKEKILVKCIKKLKEFNIPILLSVHLEVREEIKKLVDYYIFDDKNELLYFDNIKKLNINSLRYIETQSYKVNSYVDFHHDYAVLTNIRNAFNFCLKNSKSKIHYLEYDNIIDVKQYYETFINDINRYDAVIYEYDKGSVNNGYCAAFIFSIRDIIAFKLLEDITTIENHFRKNDWRLENYIINSIQKYTNNIKITNYIDNDNTINICYIWNRQILKDFLIYIVVNKDDIYISFSTKLKYLIEINYSDYNKFHNIIGSQLIKIGKYNIGNVIKIKYLGTIILEKILSESLETYSEKNYVFIK